MATTRNRPSENSAAQVSRRAALLSLAAITITPSSLVAQSSEIWSVGDAHEALQADLIRMIDIRSRAEWTKTGVAEKAWPISLHEARFSERLFAARTLADGRPIALICATGGRSGSVMRSLRQANYRGFIDVSEGMLGSTRGPGWIASGLPIVEIEAALSVLPAQLA